MEYCNEYFCNTHIHKVMYSFPLLFNEHTAAHHTMSSQMVGECHIYVYFKMLSVIK
jgi:hypothetical protein